MESKEGIGGGLLAKRSIVLKDRRGGDGLLRKGERSSHRISRNDGDVGGVEKASSMGSKFAEIGGVSLDG